MAIYIYVYFFVIFDQMWNSHLFLKMDRFFELILTLYVIWYNYMYTWRHTLYIQSMLCAHMSAKSIERGIMQLPVCINHCLCSSLISVLSKIGSPMHHSHMYATMIDKLIRILITAKELYICYIYIYIIYIYTSHSAASF